MLIVEGLESFRTIRPGAVMSIGNFDGIHRGHRSLLQMAQSLRPMSPGGVVLVTFEPHPLTVLRPAQAPPRLTPLALKQAILEAAGVDTLVLLPPSREVLDLSAEEFWQIIVNEVCPAHLIEGESFTFGKGRGGTLAKLAEWAANSSVQLHVAPPVHAVLLNLSVVSVSSSLIRWLISQGRVRDAAICLARPYALQGTVVKGNQRGRTIGTPTANLQISDQVIPADGVYAGTAVVDEVSYRAAVSIGTLPTFDGKARQVEAHLIGYSGDLYDQTLSVQITDWLREQQRFSAVEALKTQIADDLRQVARRDTLDPAREIGAA